MSFFVLPSLSHTALILSSFQPAIFLQGFGGREAKPVIQLRLADAPIWQSHGQKCFSLSSVMTHVVPVLTSGGGAVVTGLGVAAQNHPVLPETPEELVS